MQLWAMRNKTDFLKLAYKALEYLKKSNVSLDVHIIDSLEMQRLNKYRGKDVDTNVLAFPAPKEFPSKGKFLGDVFLNLTYIKKHKQSPEKMLIHGVLHLLGFDHERPGDRIKMEKLEKRLWENLF